MLETWNLVRMFFELSYEFLSIFLPKKCILYRPEIAKNSGGCVESRKNCNISVMKIIRNLKVGENLLWVRFQIFVNIFLKNCIFYRPEIMEKSGGCVANLCNFSVP